MTQVAGDDFAQLFQRFRNYAFRYECQTEYREPFEAEPWRKYREGEHDDLEWMQPWLDGVRSAVAIGRRFERVRVVSDPLTDYLRWEMHIAHVNADAGEDIRILSEQDRRALDLPGYDFWLFDDELVALMRYDNRTFTGAILVDDRESVTRAQATRRAAWEHGVPFAEDPKFQRT